VAPTEASNLKNPVPASSTVLAQAKNLYADHCADCHGKKGRGDGSNAADLERKPTNLTQPALLAQGDGALFWKISEGRKPMPAYSRKLSEEQRWKLVNYIRTLAPKNNKN
jgi:mono/diheme cytochrome c family protein